MGGERVERVGILAGEPRAFPEDVDRMGEDEIAGLFEGNEGAEPKRR